MFIQTEDTPNPHSMKFLPDEDMPGTGRDGPLRYGMDFPTAESALSAPLPRLLFEIDGVSGVYVAAGFVTVTKDENIRWEHIKPAILGVLADFLVTGASPVAPDAGAGAGADDAATPPDEYEGEDRETVEKIIGLIETRVRPAVAADGGDIVFRHYEPRTGVVYLSMRGACAGCPSSELTLRSGIENLFKHYVPAVTKVEQAPV